MNEKFITSGQPAPSKVRLNKQQREYFELCRKFQRRTPHPSELFHQKRPSMVSILVRTVLHQQRMASQNIQQLKTRN